jgi:hypothetical protein
VQSRLSVTSDIFYICRFRAVMAPDARQNLKSFLQYGIRRAGLTHWGALCIMDAGPFPQPACPSSPLPLEIGPLKSGYRGSGGAVYAPPEGSGVLMMMINRLTVNFWLTGLSINQTETGNMATTLSVNKNFQLLCSVKGSLSFENIESLKHLSKVET